MKKNLLGTVMKLSKYAVFGIILQCLALDILVAGESKAQSIFEVKLELDFSTGTLEEFFEYVEKTTAYSFTYSSSKINLKEVVKLSKASSSLGKVLEEISQANGLHFKQINHTIAVSKTAKSAVGENKSQGIFKGRVIDESTKEILPGATIKIAGSNYGTSSDVNGNFFLRLNSGENSLEISYIGFTIQTITVTIDEGETVYNDILLKSDVQELESITVYGNLQGQAMALNQQKSSENIKNVVASEQIGRFPDPNVAEALQRIPGATVERDQGEGRYVLVRGLAPQFTNISINGEQIPSPEAGVRFIALDAIPADQLASIEVTKALTPDMDGDAVGGSVNLITRTAKSSKAALNGTIVGGYNELMGKPNAQGSLQYGQRFMDEKLGVMLNSSYYFTDRGSDNWERDDSEFELRDYQLTRTRMGLSGTIDYRISNNSEVYVRGIYNRFTDHEWRRTYLFVPNAENNPFENHEIERAVKDRFESQSITSFNVGARHNLPKISIDYEVSYSDAYQDTPFDNEVVFIAGADELSTYFPASGFPSFVSSFEDPEALENDDNRVYTSETAYLNNRNYEFDGLETGHTMAQDRNITAKFNFGVPYNLGGNEALLKFGSKIRLKDKSFSVTQNAFEWAGDEALTLDQFDGGLLDDNFLGGQFTLSQNADMDQVLRFFNANRAGFELDTEGKIEAENSESYEASEDVYAAYIMSKVQLNKLMVLGGVRYEKTKVTYVSSAVIFDNEGDLDEVLLLEGGTDYDFILPQLHFKYAVNNNMNLRAAATYSYSRPNFESIVPQVVIELNEKEGTIGNPQLEPVSAFNLDFMAEKYFGTVGILSGGVFFKRLDNFIYNGINEVEYNGVQGVEITQAVNGNDASLTGIEIAYQQNLSFLPGLLSGVGIYMNYTYTGSTANLIRDDINEEINLPGQAEHIGNFSLSYDKGKFNTRISANYRGSYLTEIGQNNDEDIYLNERLQLDWTLAYAVNKKFRVFAEFMNLTDAPFEAYIGNKDNIIQSEYYSWWSRIGLKFDL